MGCHDCGEGSPFPKPLWSGQIVRTRKKKCKISLSDEMKDLTKNSLLQAIVGGGEKLRIAHILDVPEWMICLKSQSEGLLQAQYDNDLQALMLDIASLLLELAEETSGSLTRYGPGYPVPAVSEFEDKMKAYPEGL